MNEIGNKTKEKNICKQFRKKHLVSYNLCKKKKPHEIGFLYHVYPVDLTSFASVF